MIFYMFGFTVLVLLVILTIFYLNWINKKQKLDKESYNLHLLMQKHYEKLQNILTEIKPLMTEDKEFYQELQEYIKANFINYPLIAEADALDAKEFYLYLLHLEENSKLHVEIFTKSITLELDQMKLSLMRARDSYSYADNEYKFLTSTFPTNIIDKLLKPQKLKYFTT